MKLIYNNNLQGQAPFQTTEFLFNWGSFSAKYFNLSKVHCNLSLIFEISIFILTII
jgi:hypothetical protein